MHPAIEQGMGPDSSGGRPTDDATVGQGAGEGAGRAGRQAPPACIAIVIPRAFGFVRSAVAR